MKYAQFRQDIKSLGDSLGQLQSIIDNAHNQCSPSNHFGGVLQVLPDVTGDFRQTLNDCKKLLRSHAGLKRGRPSPLENFRWWTSVEGDVCSLRERVKFHITKVTFIAKPFETQLLLGIQRDVQQLRRDVAILTRNAADPPSLDTTALPDDIFTRFTVASNLDQPASFKEKSDWPLKEGFDALVYHYSRSTIEFNSRPELGQNIPEGPQYLNLLKCTWIMERLKSSSHFTNAGTNSLWADYMRGLEDEIRDQFRRFESRQLIAPMHDVISMLPDSYYSIWVVEGPPRRPLDMSEQRPLEERILEVSLPQSDSTCQSSLTVFRKSHTQFRLVTTTKRADNPMFHHAEGFHVDMTSTRLIPSYAAPNEKFTVTNNIVLCNDKGQLPEWISLSDSTEIASLQRALTGYRVHHDMSNLSWCINGSKEEENWGDGRLQLWQSKPLPEILLDRETQSTNGRNVSVTTVRLPQLDLGSQMFSEELADLGPDQVNNGRSTNIFAEGTTPTAVNGPGISNGVAESSNSTSYQMPWNADSTTAAYSFSSHPPHSTGTQSPPLSSPSSSKNGWASLRPLSKESTRKSDLKPNLKRHSTGRSSSTLVTHSSIASPVNGPHGDGIELFRPKVPVLFIFTMCRARYTFLHVEREQNLLPQIMACPLTRPSLIQPYHLVEPNILINPHSCACRNPRKACTRAVLESKTKKKPFTVYRYSAEQEYEKGLFSWDLALFRSPRRQELKKWCVVEKMKTLDLAFSTVAGEYMILTCPIPDDNDDRHYC